MKRFTRNRIIVVTAAMLLSAALGGGYWHYSTKQLAKRFGMATLLPPAEMDGTIPLGWDCALETPDGSQVRLIGKGGLGGDVDVHYGDGSVERVYSYTDYVYATQIRLSETRKLLYVEAEGLAGGLYSCRRINEYDLSRRKILASRQIPSWIAVSSANAQQGAPADAKRPRR